MTPVGLVPLRLTATLAHGLPGIRLRLRDGQATLLEVVPGPGGTDGGRSVTPCAFRGAVARAHHQIQEGVRLRFLGLPEGDSPSIDVGVRNGDRIHPCGVYEVATPDGRIEAFATTLSPRACRDVLADVAGPEEVRLHHDVGTEVTLVHTVGPLPRTPGGAPVLEDAVLACAVEEVCRAPLVLGP
ncbi:MAG: hypothetical protein AB7L84_08240 [Acidimicrobiia bacterium]